MQFCMSCLFSMMFRCEGSIPVKPDGRAKNPCDTSGKEKTQIEINTVAYTYIYIYIFIQIWALHFMCNIVSKFSSGTTKKRLKKTIFHVFRVHVLLLNPYSVIPGFPNSPCIQNKNICTISIYKYIDRQIYRYIVQYTHVYLYLCICLFVSKHTYAYIYIYIHTYYRPILEEKLPSQERNFQSYSIEGKKLPSYIRR